MLFSRGRIRYYKKMIKKFKKVEYTTSNSFKKTLKNKKNPFFLFLN